MKPLLTVALAALLVACALVGCATPLTQREVERRLVTAGQTVRLLPECRFRRKKCWRWT